MTLMKRNQDDVWPDDAPVGTFDIEENGVEGYPLCTARIEFVCPNKQHCSVLLGAQFAKRPKKGKCNIWAWDGNKESPTITPSINCVTHDEDGQPTGCCGWHGHITGGNIQ